MDQKYDYKAALTTFITKVPNKFRTNKDLKLALVLYYLH